MPPSLLPPFPAKTSRLANSPRLHAADSALLLPRSRGDRFRAQIHAASIHLPLDSPALTSNPPFTELTVKKGHEDPGSTTLAYRYRQRFRFTRHQGHTVPRAPRLHYARHRQLLEIQAKEE